MRSLTMSCYYVILSDSEESIRLHQAQLAGARYGFGASLDLQFAIDNPIVPFNSTQGKEKPLANLTIRESLGNEL